MGPHTMATERESSLKRPVETNYSTGNGGFLVSPCPPGATYTKEQLTEEQLEIGRLAANFCKTKVEPLNQKLDEMPFDSDGTPVVVKLFREAGSLGLLALGIPEQYGGLELDMLTNMHMAENVCRHGGGSFSLTSLSHIGIGTMPISLFGNDEQKKKYLPKLASGEWLACYALTEPGSGSDALSGRSEARLEGDYYILNGSKQFITNGGWANVAVVFTQIQGQYSALIVELNQPGVSRGVEEKKMGIKGSSTTALLFDNVKVPKENLLGEIGDASKIALNILNIGRLELGFGCLGGCKRLIEKTVKYASERKQFGRPIIEFDIQTAKLADMVVRTFGAESIAYRTVAPIDQKIEESSDQSSRSVINALRSYAMEASICKVDMSEAMYAIADSAVKMHGGYGYVQEYDVERTFRDCIINMIFEGTNDINRLVIFDFLVRNIYGGSVPYRTFMEEVDRAVRERTFQYPLASDMVLRQEKERLYAAKYMTAFLVQRAILRYGKDITHQQQVIEHISNLLIDLYVTDSVLSRVHYLMETNGHKNTTVEQAIAKLTAAQRLDNVRVLARRIILDITEEYETPKVLKDMEWLLHLSDSLENTFVLKRVVANAVIEKGEYYF